MCAKSKAWLAILFIGSIGCGGKVSQSNHNNLGADTSAIQTLQYQCTTDACGAQAQQRTCVGDSCDDWTTIQSCDENQACWSNESGAGCSICAVGCSDGKCRSCADGPCCDNGSIRGVGVACTGDEYQSKETRCQTDVCGGAFYSRILNRTCDGKTAECNGSIAPLSDWKVEITCGEDSVCDNDRGCVVCEKGCFSGNCIQCTDGPCCDIASGLLRAEGTECNHTIGYYCEPTGYGGIAIAVKTFQICDGTNASCGGPLQKKTDEYICSPQQLCQADKTGARCVDTSPGYNTGH